MKKRVAVRPNSAKAKGSKVNQYKQGDIVRILRGTKVVMVSRYWVLPELTIYDPKDENQCSQAT